MKRFNDYERFTEGLQFYRRCLVDFSNRRTIKSATRLVGVLPLAPLGMADGCPKFAVLPLGVASASTAAPGPGPVRARRRHRGSPSTGGGASDGGAAGLTGTFR